MKLEQKLICGFTIAGLVVSACGGDQGSSKPEMIVPPTGNSTLPDPGVKIYPTFPVPATIESRSAETVYPIISQSTAVLSEPPEAVVSTPVPEILKLGQEVKGTMYIEGEDAISLDFTPERVSVEGLARFDELEGNLAMVSEPDKYGNLVIMIHSGFDPGNRWRKLPAQDLRAFFDGGWLDEVTRLDKLRGAIFTMEINGEISLWRIGAVQVIERGDVDDYSRDTYNLVDVLTDIQPVGGFEEAKQGGGVIFSTCVRWNGNSRLAMWLVPVVK